MSSPTIDSKLSDMQSDLKDFVERHKVRAAQIEARVLGLEQHAVRGAARAEASAIRNRSASSFAIAMAMDS